MTEQILAVQKMQDYIEENLFSEITFADLGKAAGFSPWYARRLFLKHTGLSPADYIRRMRLSKSALRLKNESVKIADIAFETGFDSVDGYQRAFFREFGCNPRQYALSPVPICIFVPYGVKYRNLKRGSEEMEKVSNVFIQLVEKPERKAVIKRSASANDYFTYCEQVGCDVWGILLSMAENGNEPMGMWLPENMTPAATGSYVQGVEKPMDFAGEIPEGFEVITLPAAKYLMFCGEAFAEEDYEKAINAMWEAEHKYDPAVIGMSWDNKNPKMQLEPVGKRGYIELLPVK